MSFIRTDKEKKYVKHLLNYCENVYIFKKRPPWSITSLTLAALTFYPLVVCMYLNREVRKIIASLSLREKFDLIHAETFYVMPNIPKNKIPIILVEQTIEYMVYKHFTKHISFLPIKLLMSLDVAKIHFWERRFWRRSTRVVAMSQTDKVMMQSQEKDQFIDLVPNGVDTVFFRPGSKIRKNNKKTILFVGNFKWLQNREAVTILVEKIWPKVASQLPQSKLWIVGKHPSEDIKKLNCDSIQVSSDLNDIREAYRGSDVLLAPIYGPGGTRYKILESMAAGLPVVSTPTGVEGLGVEYGKHALVYENYEDLAHGCVKVLKDPDLYLKLSKEGRHLVKEKFSWDSIAKKLDQIYKEAADEKNS